MNHFVEDIMAGFSGLFIFNNASFLKGFDGSRFMFWVIMYALLVLIMYKFFKSRALFFASFNLAVFLILIAVSNVFFPDYHEMLYAAETYMAIVLFLSFYLFFLWIPIRLQYDPGAEEKIRQLLMSGPMSDEDLKKLYRLKSSTKEAYDSNIKWLLNIEMKKNKEI